MSKSYLYPRWGSAKHRLIEAIESGMPVREAVETFFKNHMFEISCQHRIMRDYRETLSSPLDHDWYYEERALQEISMRIKSHGLFTKQTELSRFFPEGEEITTYRVLVFGAPEVTGPGTRELADIVKMKR